MSPQELLAYLVERKAVLETRQGELVVRAPRGVVDSEIAALLKAHKESLLVMSAGDSHRAASQTALGSGPGCGITPQMLPLVELTQPEIDEIVSGVAGGVSNVQDIYPLAPLQEGILFHHLLQSVGDAYLLRTVLAFDDRPRLEGFLAALQRVIDRHDILRSAVYWEKLRQPVQVVHRQARLPVEEVVLSGEGAALSQLLQRTDPGRVRRDLRCAPLMVAYIAADPHSETWWLSLLNHHMVSDHVTLDLVIAEIRWMLQGEVERLEPALPYRNFIAQLRAVSAPEQESYFRGQLGDIEEPTAPFGILDVRNDAAPLGQAHCPLSEELAHGIRASARQQGVTPAVLFHVAWGEVLRRCTGLEEVVFGTVLSGRLQGTQGASRILGMFINTLPIRLSRGVGGVRGWVMETHRRLSELLLHEQASLALAQRCSGVAPPIPLFTTVLNYRHTQAPAASPVAEGCEGIRMILTEERTHYPLMVAVDDLGQGFSLTAQSQPGIDAERIVHYFRTALEGLVAALRGDEQTPGRLEVLPEAEREQLLRGFNATRVEYPQDRLIHELFEEQVERTPDAIAVCYEEQRLTYGELNARANQLAHELLRRGVRPDDRVGICLERGVELVVGLLGILKSGGAYVPLDPGYPADRLEYMLRDAAPAVVLTQAGLKTRLPETGARVLMLDGDGEVIAQHARTNPAPSALKLTSHHLAYVIYTSGSTGEPKGVMVEHGSVVNFLRSMCESPGLSAADSLLAVTTLSFDIAGLELYLPLIVGAKVTLLSRAGATDVRLLEQVLEHAGITVMQATPATWRLLLDGGWQGHGGLKVLCGGEALGAELSSRLRACVAEVWNLYGPTETTIWSSCRRIEAQGAAAIESIGRPIANTQIYVLDRDGEPVPIGVSGEIHIGGAGVARGYWNRAELTAQRFIRDPFSADVRSRLYKSGDVGRYRADGTLEYLGRNDHQVKIRGFRIELGEIEAQLSRCAGVREAVVVAREEVAGDKRLVGYVVIDAESDLRDDISSDKPSTSSDAIGSIRAHLQRTLPEHMVPAVIVRLTALPLTPNGKLDRGALPAPDLSAVMRGTYEAPQGVIEQSLAQIWQELLQVERIGRHDNFFELGGHSLLAVQVVTRVRRALDRELALRDLFESPTVESLSKRLELNAAAVWQPIERTDRAVAVPLSYAQQRLWFIDHLEGGGSAYHIAGAVKLEGELDREALGRTLDDLLERHESLRTTFQAVEGVARQVIAERAQFALREMDLSALSEPEREAAVQGQSREEARARFELSTGPLIRGRLLKLSALEHVLLVTMHHIISDGWSLGILIREVGALYAAHRESTPAVLPELAIQYADYAAWQRQWLQGEVLERELGYWKEQLRGSPVKLELPTDRVPPAVQSYRGGSVEIRLDAALSTGLRELCRRHDVTLYMALYAGYAILLSKLSGQRDLVIGTPIANRHRVEVEGLIGFFVNTLALRIGLEDDPSVSELLGRVRQLTLEAYSHQDVPFEQVVEALNPPRSLGHSPVFQAMLVLNNTPIEGELRLAGLSLTPLSMPSLTTQFDLTLSLQEQGEELVGSLGYASDLFDEETIERWAGHLRCVLESLVADASQRVSAVRLLSEEERRRIVMGFNATRVEYAQDRMIHELFEEQVERTPDAIAVCYEEQRLTYGELNTRANQLAHELLRRGVRPDDRVGICLERGVELVVGLLGILKSGGAYVPLDPGYPADRLEYMLRDAAPAVVLTQAGLKSRLPETGACVLTLDGDGEVIAQHAGTNLASGALKLTSHHLAYVMYTSGSTGEPKGVMVEHRNVSRLFAAAQVAFHFDDRDVWTLFHSFAFDFSVWELWGALLYGGRLIVVPYGTTRSPTEFYRLLCQEGVTVLNQTPSAFRQLDAAQAETDGEHVLRLVIFGGEALEVHALKGWVERNGALKPQLVNMYGITETTVHVTCRPLTRAGIEQERSSLVGRPLPDLRVYLLDPQGEPVPIGVSGEIHIGGAGVARGYWNRPELTAQRFIRDPFSAADGARLYKSGDMGRYRADGTLEYLGRSDHQVKIRGFRIELGEIEAQLRRCAGVREAVVVAREDVAGDKRLVGYVVSDVPSDAFDTGPEAIGSMRAHLQRTLPEHMVPAAIVMLTALPLTPNGKLDRGALPAPNLSAVLRGGYEAPQGVIEQSLAQIWQELLQVERVGRHDNFFELGGHSLLAVQAAARLLQLLGVEVPLRMLFAHPTLSLFATAIIAESSLLCASSLVAIRTDGTQRPLFLIHPAGGEIKYATDLARWLQPDLPVYGLAAKGLLSDEIPLTTIEEMAALYIREILRVQPSGPYRFAGWSVGGSIAFEMAAQLLKHNEHVEFVGLIDTWTRARNLAEQTHVLTLEDVALFAISQTADEGSRLKLKMSAEAGDIDAMIADARAAGLISGGMQNHSVLRHLQVLRSTMEAASRYMYQPLQTQVWLFTADHADSTGPAEGWRALLGDYLNVIPIGGTHLSIMEPPYIEQLGHAISALLISAGLPDETQHDLHPPLDSQRNEARSAH